ncbi:MAG TPA: FG-GAP-like repeat-containing protein [Chitinophagaceae bacterium]|nr:FG-GAP-like repeat-containing protein [Chitinophagaceae bacterium]
MKKVLFITCAFFYCQSIFGQPVIQSILPSAAPIGSTVTIMGSNFNPVAASNIVYFGPVRAVVTTANANSLSVVVPVGATHQLVTVSVNGSTAYSPHPFNVISGSSLTPTSFSVRKEFAVGNSPFFLLLCDLDADRRSELLVTNFNSSNFSVLKNTSTPGIVSFDPAINFSTGVEPDALSAADLNADGKQDIVATSISGHMFSVFINTSGPGNISFAPRIDFSTGASSWPRGIAICDMDGDGKPDIVLPDNNKIYDLANNFWGTLSIFRNTTVGGIVSFASPVSYKTNEYPKTVSVSDLDGDMKLDIVVANHVGGDISVFKNNSTPGNINFSSQATLPIGGRVELLELGDFDGDGKDDLAVSTFYGGSKFCIFRNTSNVGVISFGPRQEIDVYPIGISIGDVDGNGKPDLSMANYGTGKATVYVNNSSVGNISFSQKFDYDSDIYPGDILEGDIDGDGYPDLSLSNLTLSKVSILRMAATVPTIDLGKDTTFCEGDSLLLNANTANGQYLWSTGSIANSIIVKQSGTYWVRVTTPGFVLSDTIKIIVKPNPIVDLGKDSILCEGRTIILDAFNAGATYTWNNGSASSSITPNQSGVYNVKVDLNGCIKKDTVIVTFKRVPRFSLGNDTSVCNDQPIILDPKISGVTYLWQDGSTSSTYSVTQGGTYKLTITDQCGSYSDEIVIRKLQACLLIMPNAFTPNNDGANDLFRIPPGVPLILDDFSIYDRWGNKIFTTNDIKKGWDGTYKGTKLSTGVFVYTVSGKLNNEDKFLKGTVLLIR